MASLRRSAHHPPCSACVRDEIYDRAARFLKYGSAHHGVFRSAKFTTVVATVPCGIDATRVTDAGSLGPSYGGTLAQMPGSMWSPAPGDPERSTRLYQA